jgi:Pentapeptide repeats (8 copies)
MKFIDTEILVKPQEELQLAIPLVTNKEIESIDAEALQKINPARIDGEELKDFTRVNLTGRDLEGIDLSGACLSGANLANCNLRGARLDRCDLRLVNFQGTDLSGASLRGANCEGAIFLGTNWRNADLEGANLRGATIDAVKCKRTNLTRVSLTSIYRSGRERVVQIKHPCFIPKGEYDLDGLLNESGAQYERARKLTVLLMLGLFLGFLKYLAFRFSFGA